MSHGLCLSFSSRILSCARRNTSLEINPASKSRWLTCNLISFRLSCDNLHSGVDILPAPFIFYGCWAVNQIIISAILVGYCLPTLWDGGLLSTGGFDGYVIETFAARSKMKNPPADELCPPGDTIVHIYAHWNKEQPEQRTGYGICLLIVFFRLVGSLIFL